MIYKLGSEGRSVTEIQGFLRQKGFWPANQPLTTKFGPITEAQVKLFQKSVGLKPDGEVGDDTYNALLRGTDAADAVQRVIAANPKMNEKGFTDVDGKVNILDSYVAHNGLLIHREYLDTDEYVRDFQGLTKEWEYLHHTAGWHDPSPVVKAWNNDKLGRICTQHCVGGSDVLGRPASLAADGKVVECFPDGFNGWHLGKVISHEMHKRSGGIELCNFGQLTEVGGTYKTYTGATVKPEFVLDLGSKFRQYRYWHKYSDAQLKATKLLLEHKAKVNPKLDIRAGLPKLLREGMDPFKAFDYMADVSAGKIKGLWTHTNVRKDKFDCFPQPQIVELLKSL